MGVNFNIQEAVREKIAPKIALMGASGSGKSFSALRLATGMKSELEEITGEKWRIIVGNTEKARGVYYANEFEYAIQNLEPPFEPELFVSFMEYVEKLTNTILILDSSSHEWEGKGGCLEIHSRLGGRYQDWAKVTPRHDKFINTLAGLEIPVIATMRGKDQYVMNESDNSGRKKTVVEKVGVGAKQREGFEYEFTATFMLDQKTNLATQFKDNTHIFDTEGDVKLTEDHGRKIIRWANNGKDKEVVVKNQPKFNPKDDVGDEMELDVLLSEIDVLAKEKVLVNKSSMIKAIKHYNSGSADYTKITDIEVAKSIKNALNTIK